MIKRQRVVISSVFMVLALGFFPQGSDSAPLKNKGVGKGVDVPKIEADLQKMRKRLDSFPSGASMENTRIKRDPFVSLITTEKNQLPEMEEITKPEEESIIMPEFTISGILLGGEKLFVIIDNEVKAEGDFIKDYQILKIVDANKVLILHRDKIFTLTIMNNEVKPEKIKEDVFTGDAQPGKIINHGKIVIH